MPISQLASKSIAALVLTLPAVGLTGQSGAAGAYTDLYDFGASYAYPTPYPLVMAEGPDDALYGVTAAGGTQGKGTVFRVGSEGGLTTRHNFDGVHGSTPVGGLTLGPDGDLYGMAEHGGAHGYGEIFRITPAGSFTVLYSFTGEADGGYPVSPLITGSDGALYGTSYPGVAFRITKTGRFSVLTKIPTTSYGPLVQAYNGSLYGVTEFGGKYSAGTVYRIDGSVCTVLHSFDGPSGSYPVGGLVQGSDGNFYGTTTAGGTTNAGVIYEITGQGTYKVLLSFDNRHPLGGYQSYAGLVEGGNGDLYGVTIWGGKTGDGVIFSVNLSGAYSVLYNFDSPVGTGAYATPVQDTNGFLYGMTNRGGGGKTGVIYRFADGSPAFVRLVSSNGVVGSTVNIVGHGFSGATSVSFNGTPASFRVLSDTLLSAVVPSGETGIVDVVTSQGQLFSFTIYRVAPQMTTFSPEDGQAGDTVTVRGKGLVQTSAIAVGGVRVTAYSVLSDSSISFRVPQGARTGQITLTTPGGSATSGATFTVDG